MRRPATGLALMFVAMAAGLLASIGPLHAAEPGLRFYRGGVTMTLSPADIPTAELNSETGDPVLIMRFAPEAARRITDFTSRLVGRPTSGIFDDRLWFSNMIVREEIASESGAFSGFDATTIGDFIARLDTLRGRPDSSETPIVTFFETDEIYVVSPDVFRVMPRDDDSVAVCVGRPSRDAFERLEITEGQSWWLILGDHVVDDWSYRPEDKDCPVVIAGTTADTFREAGIPVE